MDTLKGQDNNAIANSCADNDSVTVVIVIVPHNLPYKLQPLDIAVNKTAKFFISQKYNKYFAEEVA